MSTVSNVGANQGLFQFLQHLQSKPQQATGNSGDGQTAEGVQGGHHRHHRDGAGSLFQQIQSAVAAALQANQPGQSGGSSDPNQVIQQAIIQALDGAPGQTAAGQTAGGNGSATTPVAGAQTGQQNFVQLLQSYGVTPEQFRQDFLLALKTLQNGQTASTTGLTGAAVDTSA